MEGGFQSYLRAFLLVLSVLRGVGKVPECFGCKSAQRCLSQAGGGWKGDRVLSGSLWSCHFGCPKAQGFDPILMRILGDSLSSLSVCQGRVLPPKPAGNHSWCHFYIEHLRHACLCSSEGLGNEPGWVLQELTSSVVPQVLCKLHQQNCQRLKSSGGCSKSSCKPTPKMCFASLQPGGHSATERSGRAPR